MQIPLSPILSHPSVVINPVSDIGILLNLRNENIPANGMNRSGLNKKHISLLHRHSMEHFQQSILPDPLGEFLPGYLPLKAVIKVCLLPGLHHIPHLGLAILSLILQGIPVIRMNLNRQIILSVNKFGQNREIPETSAVLTQHLFSFRINIFLQGFPLISSVFDIRRPCRMAGKLPRLGKYFPRILFSVFLHQTVAAPQIILTAGLQL